MAVILILIDACRSEYIDSKRLPLLADRLKNNIHIKQTEASFGFCERTEIIAGLNSKLSSYTFAIDRVNKFSSLKDSFFFKIFKFISYLNNFYIFKYINDNIIRSLIERIRVISGFGIKPYSIPFNFYPHFKYTEDSFDHSLPNAFNQSSIYDIAREIGEIDDSAFTAVGRKSKLITDEDRKNYLLNLLNDNNEDKYSLITLYLNELDDKGHNLGPDSSEMSKSLVNFDKSLNDFISKIITLSPDSEIVLVGDHGMEQVKEILDIEAILSDFDSNFNLNGKDYHYFLDSTVFRIWPLTEKGDLLVENLKSLFNSEKYKKLLYGLDSVSLDNTTANYGWVCRSGVLIFPDFFHRVKPYKGMHGYNPSNYNSTGFIGLINSDLDLDENFFSRKLTDSYLIIKKLLENKL